MSTKKAEESCALVGLFNKVFAATFPAPHFKICVFVSITSLRPRTLCKLDIVNGETDAAIVSMQGPVPDDNPLTVCDLVFELRNIVFPEPGTYYIRFWGNEQILMQRAIEVVTLMPNKGKPDTGEQRDDNENT